MPAYITKNLTKASFLLAHGLHITVEPANTTGLMRFAVYGQRQRLSFLLNLYQENGTVAIRTLMLARSSLKAQCHERRTVVGDEAQENRKEKSYE